MAGNFPDVPSWRMAYDRDGTVGVQISAGGVITQMDGATLQALNDESASSTLLPAAGSRLAFIFPEKRDVDALFLAATSGNHQSFQYSTDTTNGLDGTWSAWLTDILTATSWNGTLHRTGIRSGSAFAVRGIRWTSNIGFGGTLQGVHIYGEIAPGENPHRLDLWHATDDARVSHAFFDWGDVPRSSSADKTFRVKNLSPAQTADSVRVALEALTDMTPSITAQHLLSAGGSFLAQVNVGDLAPGALSGVVTLRRTIASNAQLGLASPRVFAEADSWS